MRHFLLFLALAAPAYAADNPSESASDPPVYRNPVFQGDAPDPSVVRIGPLWACLRPWRLVAGGRGDLDRMPLSQGETGRRRRRLEGC